ncbi:MAG TPA: helix-hairpin-helix domain-containing protein [Candidatus Limnocylindrales bacterium]|nr:helix-hairpin-helix domain-containing protein [Candidatus Limnocylindrales bacterium]
MIRSIQFRTLSALAVAMILPIAAYAVEGTAAKPATPATKSSATSTMKSTDTAKPAASKAHIASHAKRHPAIDLNSASKEELMTLPGVTEDVAEKIIAGRPYKSKAELSKKQILTKAEYTKVRGHVIAKQEAKPMQATPETPATPESK